MPKLIAPHGASWRGRALDAGEIIDVSDAEVAALTAHGFRPVEQDSTGTADILSASALPERPKADGTSAVPVKSSSPEKAGELPRKDLLKLLKGRGLGNLFVKSTEELRALAAVVLAGEAMVEADHGGK
jgi:hypothetical protein